MANVQLPSINITPSDINNASLSELRELVKGLLNTTVELTEELTYLLNNLDTRNINEVDGDLLVQGTVTAGKIQVDKLSAISADLGKITAGEVYGTYIATRENAFPRAEMSNTDNLFSAFFNSKNFIQIESNYAGAPSVNFVTNGNIKGRIDTILGSLEVISLGNLYLTADGGKIDAGSCTSFVLPSFGSVVSDIGENLGVQLDGKATAGISTSMSGSHNHGIPEGTKFRDVDGNIWTWFPVGDHSHAQN